MAFFQEPERQPFLRVPAVTTGLIALLVVAHVARVLAPPELSDAILLNYAFYPARYSHAFMAAHGAGPQSFTSLAIPFVSYIFLHANFTHLALNCIWMLPFGAIVARRFGPLIFLAFFVICGVAGALAHLATHWGSMDGVIGASGAIAGLMAAGFRMIAQQNPRPVGPASTWPLAPILAPRLVVWSAVWVAVNVVAGLTGLGAGPGLQVIAWQAHIGGYFAGLVLAGPFDFLQAQFGAMRNKTSLAS